MAILTYIDSNTLIYYAKGPGLDLLSNLNSQLIITDAVRIEATRGSSPDAGIISDWINTNVADGKVVVPITPEGAALAADLTLKDMGEQSIITDAQTAVQPRDTVQIYSGDDIPAKYFAGQSIVSPDDVRGIGQSLNDIQDAVGFQNPDYANYRDGLVKAGANPEGFQSNGDLGLTNGSATGSSSTDIQASESDAQSFSSVVENTAGAPDGAAIAAEVEGATAVLDAVGLAALSIYVTTEAVQAVQQAETGDYSGAATTVADTAAGVGGMIAGAEAGGEIGAEMGAFFGPEGAAAGAIIGGVAGAVAGAATAQSVANTLGQAIGNALTDLTNFFGGAPSGNGGNDGGGSGNNGNQPYGPFGPNGPNGPNGPDGPNAPYGPNGPNPIGPSGPRKSGGKNGEARKDPLVIDLAGTGVNLVGRTWLSPYFDFTGDGFAQNTAWIGSGTGFLAVLGSDGTIDNGSDLITSFAQLAAMDTNGDGVVNSSDADFNNIVIWQDTNGDGIAQPNEIETLSQAGIVSISLTTTPASQSINGSEVVATAVATMADGTTREVASVDFDTSSFYTKYAGSYTLNSTIESLPNLQGYGTLPDLWISMSKDSTLESLVQQLTQTDPGNTATFDSALQSVLYEWAGVENVAPSSGNVFDGQKLGFLSAYLGDLSGFGLQNSRTPWFSGQSNLLQASWNDAFSAIKADLLVQLPNSVFANDFRLDPGTGLLTPQSTLSDSIIDLSIQAPTDPAGQIAFWTNALLVIGTSIADMSQYVTIDTVQIESILRTVAPSTFSTDVLNAVATGSLTYVQGSQLNNALVGTSGGDFAILTQPNSSFTGFGGNDEILVNDGLGNVEINEVDNSISPDNVLLLGAGISPSDVTVTADKAGDAVLTLADGNTIKLDYEIFGPNSGSEQAAGHTSITFGPDTNYGVQEVEFADGTVWTQQQTIGMELASATAGNDTLVGGSAPETFDGKGGSDYEQGGGNGDTFIFNQGYGKLEINETASSLTADNILKLGPGIDPSQVTVSGDTNGDVVLTIGSSGDQITIDKMLDQSFDGPQYGAQAIEFADGTVWTPQIVLAKQAINTNYTEKFTGTSGPDVLRQYPEISMNRERAGAILSTSTQATGSLRSTSTIRARHRPTCSNLAPELHRPILRLPAPAPARLF